MATQNLSQNFEASNPLSRRRFLTGLIGLIPLAIPAVPYLPESNPDPTRAGIIDHWLARLDSTIAALIALRAFLSEARALPTAAVDGERLFDLEAAALTRMDDLSGAMQTLKFEDLGLALTGRAPYIAFIKREIRTGTISPARLRAEINAIRRDDPAAGAELQAFSDAHYGGAL